MGVTEFQSYFMQIIGHNSVIVIHQIPTKLGTAIEPFKCAKFQPLIEVLIFGFCEVCKIKKK